MNQCISNKQDSCSQKVPYFGKAQLEKVGGEEGGGAVVVIKIRYEMRQESGVCNKKPVFICLTRNVGA